VSSAGSPRILLTGGGTGGHVIPALATAAALRLLRPDLEVEFVGTERGLESRLVPAAGYPLHTVEARPLRRAITPANLAVPFVIVRAARTVRRLIAERNVVVTCVFGGYTSGPLAVASRLARVPLVIHEQNAVPGLANKIAARWAQRVAISVPGIAEQFPKPERVTFTGNPVRADLAAADLGALREEAAATFGLDADRRTLLVFGGSLGARRINDAVLGSAGLWAAPERLQVLHAAGARDHERVAAAWDAAPTGGLLVRCEPFLDRMDLAYALADVVVCRSGASTVAELTACGLPSLLVPYPHAAADEQTANGRALADAGAAALVGDAELDAQRLLAEVEPVITDDRRLEAMASAARELGRPDAAAAVARVILETAGLRTGPERLPDVDAPDAPDAPGAPGGDAG
jgi:UDP-N-acetylglucosamine--N-acetylmuramyl-(pentapeptide) pyrophosphoryl-undecaprenol N-acetylglucosamine transferase